MKSLLIGCGNSRAKKVYYESQPNWSGDLVTIDMDPNCGADIVMTLNGGRLPFHDGEFDELAAYDSLEHWGKQGDWQGFFDEMGEYHRILKPGGLFGILVPVGADALGDPGHTRFFSTNHFAFLNQEWYQKELDRNSPVTDYRWYWKQNFNIEFIENTGHHLAVMLRKA